MTTCQYSTILFLRSSPWTWVQHSSVTQLRIFDITEDPNLTQSVSDVRASCSVDSSTNRLLSSVHFAFIYHVFRATLRCLVERGTVTANENSADHQDQSKCQERVHSGEHLGLNFAGFELSTSSRWGQWDWKHLRTKSSDSIQTYERGGGRIEKGPWQFDDEIIGNQMDSTCSIHEDKNCTQTFHWQ